jgi:hypothetical protein
VPPELLVVAVCFLLSLGGAWVLFKWLSSTAAITKKEYQLGGAAAGCLILYSALYASYNHLAGLQLKTYQAQLKDCQTQRELDEHEQPIGGIVSPVPKNVTVVLAVKTINPDDSGRFELAAKGLDLTKDSVALYVVGETLYGYRQLFPGDDVHDVKINLQPER